MLHVRIAVLIAMAVTSALAVDSSIPQECEADHQCENGYCYTDIGKCTPCTDCGVYKRKTSEFKTCPKSAQDCGLCLNGFEEEVFQKGAKRDFCVPSIKLMTEDDGSTGMPHLTIIYIAIGVGLCASLVVLFIYIRLKIYIRKREDLTTVSEPCDVEARQPLAPDRNSIENFESSPPPYNSIIVPSAPPTSQAITTLHFEEVEEKQAAGLVQAVPYRPAVYELCDSCREDLEDDLENDDDNSNVGSPNGLDLNFHDEETMPSDWTPNRTDEDHNNDDDKTDEAIVPAVELTSSQSTLSSLSEAEAANTSAESRLGAGDSGVSAFSSVQSSNSSLPVRHFQQFGSSNIDRPSSSADLTVLSAMPVMSRRHSDDNLSPSIQAPPNKRLRRDSGSVSMQSGPPDEDICVSSV